MMPNLPAGTETFDLPESHFIESNTQPITLAELSEKSIVPTFADNTLTVSHQSFINSVLEAGQNVFGQLTPTDIRVSHQINGRVPSALHKKANELKDNEKTVYFQRMAFIAQVEGLTRIINGQLEQFIEPTWKFFSGLLHLETVDAVTGVGLSRT